MPTLDHFPLPNGSYALASPGERARRRAMLCEPHVAPLTTFVRGVRARRRGDRIPDFDPLDGGVSCEGPAADGSSRPEGARDGIRVAGQPVAHGEEPARFPVRCRHRPHAHRAMERGALVHRYGREDPPRYGCRREGWRRAPRQAAPAVPAAARRRARRAQGAVGTRAGGAADCGPACWRSCIRATRWSAASRTGCTRPGTCGPSWRRS